MPKHYLWAVGEGLETLPPGTLIADRYLTKSSQIWVDTRPETLPEMPNEISEQIAPYLRLFPYRLHVPQLYGLISPNKNQFNKPIWLLEKGPIALSGETLLPSITSLWSEVSAMRQLNWLWQIAQLWKPFRRQDVASSLLNPELLRVQGQILRLVELQLDRQIPSLSQLGLLWQQWIPQAHPRIQKFLDQLTQQLIASEIRVAEQLVNQLDQALVMCGRSLTRHIEIAAGTDSGPTRSHNEDACYPNTDKTVQIPPNSPALAIVCDGIGGQAGGEVASQLAIDVLRQQIEKMPLHQANWDPLSLTPKLKRSTCIANDVICQRNDSEHRQGRERMGTTLVMALTHVHELYITHIGDSRAYWITPLGCHQVTLDDDVASRQVRMGYALYRDALQQGASGALIQALGITTSVTLHPTVQRFPVDEDCVFLLCSDGLSDRDRVDQYWESEILPLLAGKVDVATVRDRLIEVANTQNGHDNVTIALLYIRVSQKDSSANLAEISVAPVVPSPDDSSDSSTGSGDDDSLMDTAMIPSRPPVTTKRMGLLVLGILTLLGLGGILIFVLMALNSNPDPQNNSVPVEPSVPSPTVTETPPTSGSPSLKLKSFVQLGEETPSSDGTFISQPTVLFKEFGKSALVKGNVAPGSIFQVMEKQSTPQAGTWVELKICSTPNAVAVDDLTPTAEETPSDALSPETDSANAPILQPGDTGWIPEEEVFSTMMPDPVITPKAREKCQP